MFWQAAAVAWMLDQCSLLNSVSTTITRTVGAARTCSCAPASFMKRSRTDLLSTTMISHCCLFEGLGAHDPALMISWMVSWEMGSCLYFLTLRLPSRTFTNSTVEWRIPFGFYSFPLVKKAWTRL